MTSAVHLFAVARTFGDEAACGEWYPLRMSGRIEPVTCGRCKRSRLYRQIADGYVRPEALSSYSKGLQP